MRILTSPLVADIRGSIAGTTFKRTAAGAGAQAKRVGHPRDTLATETRHSYLALLNAAWHSFTPAQRNAWSAIYKSHVAAANDKAPRRFQSAEALFLSHNLPRLIFGLALQTTPPTLATTNAQFKPIAALSSSNYFALYFAQDPLLSGEYCFADWTIRVAASTNARKVSFSGHTLYTGPQSGTVFLYLPNTNPPKTSRWLQLRRHSSSRLTSNPTLLHLSPL
jgi:hypothetical protein